MASKVRVLQTIAGQDYFRAEPGQIMIWPDGADLETLVEKGLVEVISKERGNNMIKPRIVDDASARGAVYTKITAERPDPKIFKW